MRASDTILAVLNKLSGQPIPADLEGDISTNIPLAIAMSARSICEHLARIEVALGFVRNELEATRRGFKS